jgi:hypothetical protein
MRPPPCAIREQDSKGKVRSDIELFNLFSGVSYSGMLPFPLLVHGQVRTGKVTVLLLVAKETMIDISIAKYDRICSCLSCLSFFPFDLTSPTYTIYTFSYYITHRR